MRAADQWAADRGEPPARLGRDTALLHARGTGRGAAAILGPLQPGRVGERAATPRHAVGRRPGARQKPLPAARPEADLGDARTPRGRRRRARRLTRSALSPRRRRSSRAGTRLSPSSRPIGAIFCASSSSIRATTFRAPRCSVRPMNPTRVVEANALRFRCSGKQGYGVSPGHGAPVLRAHGRRGDHGAHHRRAGPLRHRERRHTGPDLAPRRALRLSRGR